MGRKPATIVIVHGAWVGAWRWREVADLLTSLGHRVFTPTLTGLGERAHLTHPGVNLSLHATDIANVIRYERLDRILLVGHSYGGMPVSVATSLVAPGIIQSIMYLDAFLPGNGQSLNDLVPGKPHLPENPEEYLVPPPRANLVGFNTHMAPEARAAYEDRRTPQSVHCFSEKARVTDALEWIPQKTYVLATGYRNDTFFPIAERLRKRPGWRVEEMPYTHDLQHVAVRETAAMIESALPSQ
jgi:pimeloyl-ACP methyl ester carboxylesterase